MTRDTIPCPPPMPDGWEVERNARRIVVMVSGAVAADVRTIGFGESSLGGLSND